MNNDGKPGNDKRKYEQASWWILTIPYECYRPDELPAGVDYIRGQAEIGERVVRMGCENEGTISSQSVATRDGNGELGLIGTNSDDSTVSLGQPSGYKHWQLVAHFKKRVRLGGVRDAFGPYHAEATKSKAALEYVWKERTAVDGTRFELGKAPVNRNDKSSWDTIWDAAKTNDLMSIPPDIRIRCYSTFKKIAVDYMTPEPIVRECFVFWGPTGTGKSRRAWNEAGFGAFPKDPRSKFWDGYTGQQHVVIDEFDGTIDICHILRWLDRYPVIVEVKGASVVLQATKIWLTSNINPREWYPSAKVEQQAALLRRLQITDFRFITPCASTGV